MTLVREGSMGDAWCVARDRLHVSNRKKVKP
jgi:hypothetical protein